MDRVDAKTRSRIMASIGSKNTGPELALRKACWALGLRYRLHRRDLPGTPDMAFASARVAVFADGDFWHGRRWFGEGRAPEGNRDYWVAKFEGNRARDERADAELCAMDWLPIRLWESDIKRRPAACARLIRVVACRRLASMDATGGEPQLAGG